MSNHYIASQGFACALVTRPHADEYPRVRVEGDEAARLAVARRIAAMLNGEEDPEIVRLRQIIVETNNALFDDGNWEASDIEHYIESHAEDLPDVARRVSKGHQAAMALVGPVVLDLVGG